MPKGESLGEFEHLVLLAILRLGADAYGMRIRQEIHDRTGRDAGRTASAPHCPAQTPTSYSCTSTITRTAVQPSG